MLNNNSNFSPNLRRKQTMQWYSLSPQSSIKSSSHPRPCSAPRCSRASAAAATAGLRYCDGECVHRRRAQDIPRQSALLPTLLRVRALLKAPIAATARRILFSTARRCIFLAQHSCRRTRPSFACCTASLGAGGRPLLFGGPFSFSSPQHPSTTLLN